MYLVPNYDHLEYLKLFILLLKIIRVRFDPTNEKVMLGNL